MLVVRLSPSFRRVVEVLADRVRHVLLEQLVSLTKIWLSLILRKHTLARLMDTCETWSQYEPQALDTTFLDSTIANETIETQNERTFDLTFQSIAVSSQGDGEVDAFLSSIALRKHGDAEELLRVVDLIQQTFFDEFENRKTPFRMFEASAKYRVAKAVQEVVTAARRTVARRDRAGALDGRFSSQQASQSYVFSQQASQFYGDSNASNGVLESAVLRLLRCFLLSEEEYSPLIWCLLRMDIRCKHILIYFYNYAETRL